MIFDVFRPLFHCHGLKQLQLADNELGTIPAAVSSLSLLTQLDVSKNVLTDLPETIKQCKHLAVIQVIHFKIEKIQIKIFMTISSPLLNNSYC